MKQMPALSKKIAASTLTEVLISMVIIMAVFSIAIGIYVRITTSQLSLNGRKAQQYMQNMLAESKAHKDWADISLLADSISYTKTVSPYPGYTGLLQIRIEARQNTVELGNVKEVVNKGTDE